MLVGLFDEARGDAIGCRADEGGDAADRRGVGDAEKQTGGVISLGLVERRHVAIFAESAAVACAQHEVDDADRDGHHDCRAGGVGDPHAEEGGSSH